MVAVLISVSRQSVYRHCYFLPRLWLHLHSLSMHIQIKLMIVYGSFSRTVSVVSELSLITLHWFLTMFASVVHTRILLRIWDLFFYEGSTVLFQVTLGMLKMKVCFCLFFVFWLPCKLQNIIIIN